MTSITDMRKGFGEYLVVVRSVRWFGCGDDGEAVE
jgi:hypothetical protein